VSPQTVAAAALAARPGATVVLLGGLAPRQVPLDTGGLTKAELSLRAVLAYTRAEFVRAVAWLAGHEEDYLPVVDRMLPLSGPPERIFDANDGCKVVLSCQE
jgi:threonine dehydrogenase-like Zn-dependent dehydrogenase